MTDRAHSEERPEPGTITLLLDHARAGNGEALSRAWSILYQELRAVAQNLIKGDGLQNQVDATELIGEIWIKGQKDPSPPRNRRQFFNRAFRHMSQELIDRARRDKAAKRGGGWTRRPLDVVTGELGSLDRLDEEQREAAAIVMETWQEMDKTHPDEASIAFCRLVLGLSNEATAILVERPPKQTENHWYYARARIRTALEEAITSD